MSGAGVRLAHPLMFTPTKTPIMADMSPGPGSCLPDAPVAGHNEGEAEGGRDRSQLVEAEE